MDLMVLLFCGCFWILFLEKRKCWMVLFDLVQYQHQAAYFSFRVLKIQIRRNSIHYFQRSFDRGFQSTMRCQFICSFILWVHGWGCCWGWWKFCSSMAFWDTLQGTIRWWCYSSSATSSEGWVCWKSLKRWLCGDIGLVVLSGLGSRRTPSHPVAWRAPRWRGGRHFH